MATSFPSREPIPDFPAPEPTTEKRLEIEYKLVELTNELQRFIIKYKDMNAHHVWDFAMRSKYMLSEYETIRDGRPLQYPQQFRPAAGKGVDAANAVFRDVCERALPLEMLISTMMKGESDEAKRLIESCEAKAKAVCEICFLEKAEEEEKPQKK